MMMTRSTYSLLFVLGLAALVSGCSISRRTAGRTSTSTTTTTTLSKEDALRGDIAQYAKQFLGTPYRYGGRDKKGFDCSGLTLYVMREFDIDLAATSRSQAKQGKRVNVSRARTGDLIFFKRSKLGEVFHVAMVVENSRDELQVIHSTSRGVVMEDIKNNSYWSPKINAARDVISR